MSRTPPTLAGKARRTVTLEDVLPSLSARPPQRVVALRVHRPDAEPVVLVLREEERYVLGRHDAADVVFESPSVSRLHAALRSEGGRWMLEDLGSSNGTFLQTGSESAALSAHQAVELAAGDVIELGDGGARVEALAEVPGEDPRPSGEDTLRSPAAQAFAERIELAARTRVPVFLLGPSGCGKTHTARQIHLRSRSAGAFVPVNCARLPQDASALHSELLGHVRGAFTGAESARVGKLTHANGGTLFLDEVESLSNLAQGFLLDVLEGSGDLAPLGSRELGTRAPIFRLISASKVPLARSNLRPDLCERLAEGHMWKLPTLEERREDIPGLLRFFVAEQAKMLGVPLEITDEAVTLAVNAPWPGQIRQLRATIIALAQTALAAAPGQSTSRKLVLRRADLERHLREREEAFGTPSLGVAVPSLPVGPVEVEPFKVKADARALTREQVQLALDTARGNQSVAARRLGIARNTLARRMREFGIAG